MTVLRIADKGEVVVVYFMETKILDEGTIQRIGREFQNLTLGTAGLDDELAVEGSVV